MRKRLVPALVGLTLIVGAPVGLGSAAHAAPAVDITAPGAVTARALNLAMPTPSQWSSAGGTRLQPFVAAASGRLHSLTITFSDGNNGMTARVYAADQLSIGAPNGLTAAEPGLYLGDALGTVSATGPGGFGGGNVTVPFVSAGSLVAGSAYWVVLSNSNGVGVEFRSGGAGYFSSGGSWVQPGYDYDLDVDVDTTPVAVSLSPSTPTGAHGWYTNAVTATYTCTAPVDVCPAPATITEDGDDSPSGTVTLDDEDSSFSWFHTLKVDRTAPAISGSAAPLGTGFRVTWTCADATSGIDTCPAPTDVTGVGSDTVAEETAVDNAGNTKTATVTGLVAAGHPPTITISGVTAGKTYAHGTKVTPTCTTSGTRPAIAASPVTCTGVTTHRANKDGSVTWTYTATAVDSNELGGTTTKTVKWTIAAKAKPPTTTQQQLTFEVKGLPKKTRNGYPVIDHRKKYEVSFVFRDKNGKLVKGKPIWLHSVVTDKTGTKGKPKKQLVRFHKVRGVWTKTFTPGYHYAGEYRKFGVIAPNGKRFYVVIYVK